MEEAFQPLLNWNRRWADHRDYQGYLTWGSDGNNQPENLDDNSVGKRFGAILESGLDNSPMYDATTYNEQSHVLEFADVGLMSMYIADCDALAKLADAIEKPKEARELRERGDRYRAKLQTLWNEPAGTYLNKDLHTEAFSTRLSPTNFCPMLAQAATPEQAHRMVEKHMLIRMSSGANGSFHPSRAMIRPLLTRITGGQDLGTDELPHLPGIAQLRRCAGAQTVRG